MTITLTLTRNLTLTLALTLTRTLTLALPLALTPTLTLALACVAMETGSMTVFIAASFSLGTPSLTWVGGGLGLGN